MTICCSYSLARIKPRNNGAHSPRPSLVCNRNDRCGCNEAAMARAAHHHLACHPPGEMVSMYPCHLLEICSSKPSAVPASKGHCSAFSCGVPSVFYLMPENCLCVHRQQCPPASTGVLPLLLPAPRPCAAARLSALCPPCPPQDACSVAQHPAITAQHPPAQLP